MCMYCITTKNCTYLRIRAHHAVYSTKISPACQSLSAEPDASRPLPPLQLPVSSEFQMIFSATLGLIFDLSRYTSTFTSGAFECPDMSVLPLGDPRMAKQLLPDSNEKYFVVEQLPVSPARTLHHAKVIPVVSTFGAPVMIAYFFAVV